MQVSIKDISNIVNTINGIYHEIAVKLGLSDSAFNILYMLNERGNGCNQSVMYKETGMTRSTVNSSIRRLEKMNILYLKSGLKNNTCVYLTQYGEEFVCKTIQKVVKMESEIFSQWTQEEKEFYISINERYATQLAEKIKLLECGDK